MGITEARARALLYGVHDAWNKRDIEELLGIYADDVTFWANVGEANGGPLVMTGKPALRRFFAVWKDFECLSVPYNFHLEHGHGRCNVEFYIRDPRTGLQHSGTYRQIATYQDDRIQRLEQYHDARGMAAFLSLLTADEPVHD